MNEQYLATAYHESGHIIMTYSAEYACDGVTILPNGDGNTTMNYGNDLLLVAALSNFIAEPDIFYGLPEQMRMRVFDVGFPLAFILIAGAVAEAIHRQGGIPDDNLLVELSGPDLERVANINNILAHYNPNHNPEFVTESMETVTEIFSNPVVWNTISAIAQAVLVTPNMSLNRQEIETILSNSGYFEYLNALP